MGAAFGQGIDYRVMISSALEKRFKPNAFLAELGIDFSERTETILTDIEIVIDRV
jgi:hypothetical protein